MFGPIFPYEFWQHVAFILGQVLALVGVLSPEQSISHKDM